MSAKLKLFLAKSILAAWGAAIAALLVWAPFHCQAEKAPDDVTLLGGLARVVTVGEIVVAVIAAFAGLVHLTVWAIDTVTTAKPEPAADPEWGDFQ